MARLIAWICSLFGLRRYLSLDDCRDANTGRCARCKRSFGDAVKKSGWKVFVIGNIVQDVCVDCWPNEATQGEVKQWPR
jgi:hypothetical protein